MLKQIKIENFRCFKSFELQQLGRVNLLVGKNNSGKTSILEAIRLLCSNVDEELLKQIMINRGEYSLEEKFDFSHLFYKHEINKNVFILILGEDREKNIQVKLKLPVIESKWVEAVKMVKPLLYRNSNSDEVKDIITKALTETQKLTQQNWNSEDISMLANNAFLSASKNNENKILELYNKQHFQLGVQRNNSKELKNKFVSSLSLTPYESLALFERIVLNPEEDLLYKALQIIEPDIKRIAAIPSTVRKNSLRGGFFVRLSDSQKRISLGSMGDGIWRMLGLSLALVSVKDGVLLVDEIDTGLHYTALEDMWKLVWETAKKLNVQVFATTHSRDCYEALEVLANRDDVGEEDISIQRIEKDTPRSVVYNKKGIATAAKREIEVR